MKSIQSHKAPEYFIVRQNDQKKAVAFVPVTAREAAALRNYERAWQKHKAARKTNPTASEPAPAPSARAYQAQERYRRVVENVVAKEKKRVDEIRVIEAPLQLFAPGQSVTPAPPILTISKPSLIWSALAAAF